MTALSHTTLVIQGQQLDATHLDTFKTLSGAPTLIQINSGLARLEGAHTDSKLAVTAQAEQWQYDVAYVDSQRRFSDFGLLVSDMDSTLITIECIDEVAGMLGLKDKVAAITERSMRGELDFSASLRERVGLLKGLDERLLETVYTDKVRLTPGAETLISQCKQHQVKFMLVSGGFTFFTERLKRHLGLDYAYANVLEVQDGKLTGQLVGDIIDAAAKKRLLIEKRTELGLAPEQVMAVGDGANDLHMLSEAGVGIAFRAKPVVRAQADVAINVMGLDAIVGLFQ